jgi:hypothetical protein
MGRSPHQGDATEWGVRAMHGRRAQPYRRQQYEHAHSEQNGVEMSITSATVVDQETVARLSAGFHRCFSAFEVDDDLFAPDTLFDLLPPMWRFQLEGSGATFTTQLRSIAQGPVEVDIVRTIPTTTGFVTEHVETQHTPNGAMTARRLHLCEVHGGRIHAVTTYCNGGWDDELRARHAAEAPMIRP